MSKQAKACTLQILCKMPVIQIYLCTIYSYCYKNDVELSGFFGHIFSQKFAIIFIFCSSSSLTRSHNDSILFFFQPNTPTVCRKVEEKDTQPQPQPKTNVRAFIFLLSLFFLNARFYFRHCMRHLVLELRVKGIRTLKMGVVLFVSRCIMVMGFVFKWMKNYCKRRRNICKYKLELNIFILKKCLSFKIYQSSNEFNLALEQAQFSQVLSIQPFNQSIYSICTCTLHTSTFCLFFPVSLFLNILLSFFVFFCDLIFGTLQQHQGLICRTLA